MAKFKTKLFSLTEKHIEILRQLAQNESMSDSQYLRILIDKEYERVKREKESTTNI